MITAPRKKIPDLQATVEDILVEGDRVPIPWTSGEPIAGKAGRHSLQPVSDHDSRYQHLAENVVETVAAERDLLDEPCLAPDIAAAAER